MADSRKKGGDMANNGNRGGGTDLMSSVRDRLANSPATERLLEEGKNYLGAHGKHLADSMGGRMGRVTEGLSDVAEGKSAVGSIAKAGLGEVGSKVKDKVTDVVKGTLGKSKSGPKVTHIFESVEIPVEVRVAYDQWTQFQEFNRFMKGVEGVDQEDETTTNWRAKIFVSRRTWKSTITEQVPDRRIKWTSEGAKGTVNGTVTFHELAPELTKVVLVLEYSSKGLFEWVGNRWRAQGRRARLDLKHFARFITTEGEATGSWRGEIRDGEVVRSHDDAMSEDDEQGDRDERDEADDRYEDESDEDEGAEAEDEEDERAETDDEPEDEAPDEAEDEYDDEYEAEDSEPDERETGRGRGRGRRASAQQDEAGDESDEVDEGESDEDVYPDEEAPRRSPSSSRRRR